jgi:phosphoglucosamine mutase
MSLDGFRLVVDCANGAGYKVAPRVFADLGADVVPIGTSPNGRNINEGCGSTMPELLQHLVPGVKADAGIALDGDGDRIVMVDSTGTIVDGDQILFILANERLASGMLEGPVVGTVMSNLGLEQAITALGVPFLRAKVGDRYVLEMLRKEGGTLGGEPSGHVLMLDKTTTGDAIVVALQVLAAMKRTGKTLAELAEGMPRFPQVLLNVRLEEKFDPESSVSLQEEMANVTKELGTTGRIVLRASGTEPLVRVMVEAEDSNVAESAAQRLAAAVRAAAV